MTYDPRKAIWVHKGWFCKWNANSACSDDSSSSRTLYHISKTFIVWEMHESKYYTNGLNWRHARIFPWCSLTYIWQSEQLRGNFGVVNQTLAQPTFSIQEKVYTAASQQLLIINYISTFYMSDNEYLILSCIFFFFFNIK